MIADQVQISLSTWRTLTEAEPKLLLTLLAGRGGKKPTTLKAFQIQCGCIYPNSTTGLFSSAQSKKYFSILPL